MRDKCSSKQRKMILWGGLIVIIFFYQMKFGFIAESDDGWFAKVREQYSLIDYLTLRYNTWSARIFPETMLYYIFHVPIIFWHMLNTGFIVLLSVSIVRIFKEKVEVNDILLIVLLFGYSSFDIVEGGFFWMTGSVNYLWPLAIAVYILIPIADSYFRSKPIKFSLKQILRIGISFIFSISNEQILLCVIGVLLVYHVQSFTKNVSISGYSVTLLILLLIGASVILFAPGNGLRFESEISSWFPNFNELTFLGHIRIGVCWLLEQVVGLLKGYILLISLLTISLLKSKGLKKIFFFLATVALSLAIIKPTLLLDFQRIKTISFTNLFNSHTFFSRDFLIGIFPYVFWTIFLLYIIVCSCVATGKPVFTLCCYLAGLCSCLIMFFSPTIYASGARVFNCLVLFLVLISFTLIEKCVEEMSFSEYDSVYLISIFPLISFLLS